MTHSGGGLQHHIRFINKSRRKSVSSQMKCTPHYSLVQCYCLLYITSRLTGGAAAMAALRLSLSLSLSLFFLILSKKELSLSRFFSLFSSLLSRPIKMHESGARSLVLQLQGFIVARFSTPLPGHDRQVEEEKKQKKRRKKEEKRKKSVTPSSAEDAARERKGTKVGSRDARQHFFSPIQCYPLCLQLVYCYPC